MTHPVSVSGAGAVAPPPQGHSCGAYTWYGRAEFRLGLVALACVLSAHVVAAQDVATVFESLKALYEATDGDNWTSNDNWDTTAVPTAAELSTWHGVTYTNGALTRLQLSFNNLFNDGDSLPPELGNLDKLAILDLQDNFLAGPIPSSLGNLDSLTILDLSGNEFGGSISSSLGNLDSLTFLDLRGNFFAGSIPSSLGSLSKLEELGLSNNLFTGVLPDSLTMLTLLNSLYWANNEGLCAPPDAAFQQWLNGVTDTDDGPLCLGLPSLADQVYLVGATITNLVLPEAIEFSGTSPYDYALGPDPPAGLVFDESTRTLSGTPTEAMAQTGYTYTVTDAVDSTSSQTFNIEVEATLTLDAVADQVYTKGEAIPDLVLPTAVGGTGPYGHELSGLLPDGLDFDELSRTLSGTPTAEMAPTEYTYTVTDAAGSTASLTFTIEVRSAAVLLAFSALKALYGATNGGSWNNNANWDTTMVPTEAELRMWYGVTLADGWLTELSLANNSLNGTIPDALGSLDSLKSLNLNNNFLGGSIPDSLGNLGTLHFVNLSHNALDGAIPVSLGNLTHLKALHLGSNDLSGTIPSVLGDLVKLRWLNLNENALDGSIPDALGKLTLLDSLDLGDNALNGSIPDTVGALTNLRHLALDNNALDGSIPGALGKLTSLRYLVLGSNTLSGPVPSELGQLAQLKRLDLRDNSFTGALPLILTNLTNIQHFHFGGQSLCAPLDAAFQAWLSAIPDVSGPSCSPLAFDGAIADQLFPARQAISPLILPEATGGAPPIAYMLTPALLAGLVFDAATRTISGTPTVVTSATPYTYTATDVAGSSDSLTFTIQVYDPTDADRTALPEAFVLSGNYPNPFRGATHITFDLPWPARVHVAVTDVLGRQVVSRLSKQMEAGWERSIRIDGTQLSSGLYFYRVHALSPVGGFARIGQLVVVK